jgi:hypothetical protein
MEAGTFPGDPKLDAYHGGPGLLGAVTGGDADIAEAPCRMWENEDPAQISHDVVDRGLRRQGVPGGGVL